MTALIIILSITIYFIVGRVIVMALNKYGYIDDVVLDLCDLALYIFLPITLFVIGVREASNYLIKLFNLKKS